MTQDAGARETNETLRSEDRLVESPTDLKPASRRYVLRRTLREFISDQCTDLAAALTYYAVLAVFPAVIALLSMVGVAGQGQQTVDTLLKILSDVGASSAADSVRPVLEDMSSSPGAGLGLILGLVGALWSASGYVGAFGRAMNRIYEVPEGRPVWKLRPMMLLLTLVLVVLAAVTLVGLVVTGPAAESVGNAVGLGSTAVLIWGIAKWPIMLFIVGLMVALLYYSTPNVKQPAFRWVSVGAALAIVTWIVLSAAFGFYVANFSSYDKTYGSLAAVVVFLLWLWLTNLALLFGAELDAELERGRELQSGIAAEQTIQLPVRDDRKIRKSEKQEQEDLARGRAVREQHADDGGTDKD